MTWPRVATPEDPNACRYRHFEPAHVCTDHFGDPLPVGSAKACHLEMRLQLTEQHLVVQARGLIKESA